LVDTGYISHVILLNNKPSIIYFYRGSWYAKSLARSFVPKKEERQKKDMQLLNG